MNPEDRKLLERAAELFEQAVDGGRLTFTERQEWEISARGVAIRARQRLAQAEKEE